jgi:hypothetical protein
MEFKPRSPQHEEDFCQSPQCRLWRFLNSLYVGIARQILSIQRRMREAVWAASNIALKSDTIPITETKWMRKVKEKDKS